MTSETFTGSSPVLLTLRKALSQPHPALSAAVLAVKSSVCAQHVSDVRAHLSQTRSLDDDTVLDDLPHVLDVLAEAYVASDGVAAIAMLGPAHASARDGQGFTLEQVFAEYAMFGRSLRRHVIAQLNRPLELSEEEALRCSLETLLGATLASFHGQREGRLRLETTALGHFLTSLAHDLRNEINGVMTTMQMLDQQGRDLLQALGAMTTPSAASAVDQVAELLYDVEGCHRQMESTVAAMTQLLQAERLRNAITPQGREVALTPLMQGVVRSAARIDRGTRRDKSHAVERIKISCPDDSILWTDPDLLGTVLVNLVSNAVKHVPEGEIFFTATFTSDRCRIEVRDQGPGISAAILERLFEKFARGANPTTGGLGLGLFIARRAAELLGGKIIVESAVGRGSSFILELPRRLAAAAP